MRTAVVRYEDDPASGGHFVRQISNAELPCRLRLEADEGHSSGRLARNRDDPCRLTRRLRGSGRLIRPDSKGPLGGTLTSGREQSTNDDGADSRHRDPPVILRVCAWILSRLELGRPHDLAERRGPDLPLMRVQMRDELLVRV